MKVAIYARVSTDDKGQDVDLQLRPMREYCEKMGWDFEEYTDYISGAKSKRPGLDQVISLIRQKKIDILMVWKLDRLARSLRQLIDIVYSEMQPRNIDFICLTQAIDTTTPTGKLLFGVLGALAEFEHDLIGERVRAGMANAKKKGIKLGRKSVVYDRRGGKAIIRRILDAYRDTSSIRGTARKVDMPPGTVHGILKREGVLSQ